MSFLGLLSSTKCEKKQEIGMAFFLPESFFVQLQFAVTVRKNYFYISDVVLTKYFYYFNLIM